MATVDLNCDLGEGFGAWQMGDDAALLDIVTSVNVATGFHAGDPSIMRATCRAAAARGVAVGAHVSYPDLAGFGRRFIDIDPSELTDAVLYQLGALDALARVEGTVVRYLKPHGALYHAATTHEAQANAVVRAIVESNLGLAVLGAPRSLLLLLAEAAGVDTVTEAFADRGYLPDGNLVPRGHDGAVLYDPDHITARVVTLVTTGVVTAVDGSQVAVAARSVCVHGDSPHAVQIARSVRAALEAAGVDVAPFATSP